MKQNYRLLYDTKGRFSVHSITDEEAKFKLAKVKRVSLTGPSCVFFILSLSP